MGESGQPHVRDTRFPGYDAFLSYSHARDARLAPAFQRELERFAKPWYRIRALRVFRDNASLTANPGLWASIEQALANSEWFVLMASPEAARSSWINREVAWWVANRSVRRLLIVLTEGDPIWNTSGGETGRSAGSALPPTLRAVLREEPRWVDLRWLQRIEQVDWSTPRLRDSIADVAAAVRGVPKDLLIGEHIEQHRRAMRLARGGVAALALLLVATTVAAIVAVAQRNNARNEARIATARQLAALAVADLDSNLDRAELFAAAAYRIHRDPQTRAALFRAVAASPHLKRYLPAGARVSTVGGSADGHIVLAGTADGHVVRWDLVRDVRTSIRLGNGPITSLAADTEAHRILAADGARAVLWDTATGRQRTIHSGRSALVAVSPSGRRLALLDRSAVAAVPAEGEAELTVYDGASGQQRARSPLTTVWTRLGLPDEDNIMLIGVQGRWERRAVDGLGVRASSEPDLSPADAGTVGYSADGRYYGYDVFGQVSAWDIATAAGPSRFEAPDLQASTRAQQPDRAEAFTISRDGTRVATAAAGTVYVSATGRPGAEPLSLPGNDGVNTDALAFLGDDRLVSASGDRLSVWDITSPGRFGADLGGRLAAGCNACIPALTPSPDGHRAAFVTIDRAAEYRLSGLAQPQILSAPAAPEDFPGDQTVPVWSADGTRLALLGLGTSSALVWDPGRPAEPIGRWPPAVAGAYPLTARVSADGATVVAVNSHGDVVLRRFSDGTVRRIWPGHAELDTSATATVSADLRTAALVENEVVTLINTRTGARRALPDGAGSGVLFIQDQLLVLRPSGTLEVWDLTGTRLLRSISGSGGYQPVFSAPEQGGVVARLRSDNMVVLTQLDSGLPLGSFPLPASRSRQTVMAFTPDGAALLVGVAGGRLTRWEMTEAAWLRVACASAGRSLSPAEWNQFVGTAMPGGVGCGP